MVQSQNSKIDVFSDSVANTMLACCSHSLFVGENSFEGFDQICIKHYTQNMTYDEWCIVLPMSSFSVWLLVGSFIIKTSTRYFFFQIVAFNSFPLFITGLDFLLCGLINEWHLRMAYTSWRLYCLHRSQIKLSRLGLKKIIH